MIDFNDHSVGSKVHVKDFVITPGRWTSQHTNHPLNNIFSKFREFGSALKDAPDSIRNAYRQGKGALGSSRTWEEPIAIKSGTEGELTQYQKLSPSIASVQGTTHFVKAEFPDHGEVSLGTKELMNKVDIDPDTKKVKVKDDIVSGKRNMVIGRAPAQGQSETEALVPWVLGPGTYTITSKPGHATKDYSGVGKSYGGGRVYVLSADPGASMGGSTTTLLRKGSQGKKEYGLKTTEFIVPEAHIDYLSGHLHAGEHPDEEKTSAASASSMSRVIGSTPPTTDPLSVIDPMNVSSGKLRRSWGRFKDRVKSRRKLSEVSILPDPGDFVSYGSHANVLSHADNILLSGPKSKLKPQKASKLPANSFIPKSEEDPELK